MAPSLTRTRKHLIKHKKNYVFSLLLMFVILFILPIKNSYARRGQGFDEAIDAYQKVYGSTRKNVQQQEISEPEDAGSYGGEGEGGGEGNNADAKNEANEGNGTPSAQQETVLYDDEKASTEEKVQNKRNSYREYQQGIEKYNREDVNAKMPEVIDGEINEELYELKKLYDEDPATVVDGCYINGREQQCPVALKYAIKLKEIALDTQKELDLMDSAYYGEDVPEEFKAHMKAVKQSIQNALNASETAFNKAQKSAYEGNENFQAMIEINETEDFKKITNMSKASPFVASVGEMLGSTEWLFRGYLPVKETLEFFAGKDSAIVGFCEQSMKEKPEKGSSEERTKVIDGLLAPVAVLGTAAIGSVVGLPAIGTGALASAATSLAALLPSAAFLGRAGQKATSSVTEEVEQLAQRQESSLTPLQRSTLDYTRLFATDAQNGSLTYLSTSPSESTQRFDKINNAWSNLGDSISNAYEEKFGGNTPTPKILQNIPEVDVSSFSNSASSSSSSYAAEPVQQSSPASSNVIDELKSMSSDEWEAAFEKAGMD